MMFVIKSGDNTLYRHGDFLSWSDIDWKNGKTGELVTFETEAEAQAWLDHPDRRLTFYRDGAVADWMPRPVPG